MFEVQMITCWFESPYTYMGMIKILRIPADRFKWISEQKRHPWNWEDRFYGHEVVLAVRTCIRHECCCSPWLPTWATAVVHGERMEPISLLPIAVLWACYDNNTMFEALDFFYEGYLSFSTPATPHQALLPEVLKHLAWHGFGMFWEARSVLGCI